MFDLFRSREKAVRILLGAILLLVSLSMLTYLIPSYNNGGSSDTVVAQIGRDTITLPEVQRNVQGTMRDRQLPPELLPNFVPRVVDQMITDRALAYEATQLGFQVSDQDLADAIRQLMPSLFPDGKFVGKDAYAAMLAQNNVTIPEFEADLKQQILITKLREIAVEGTIVTPAEIEQSFKGQNEKMKIQYAKLTNDKYRGEVQPGVEDMQNYYKVNSVAFQMPEKRNLVILVADQAKLEATLNASDADLQRVYNQNQEQFRVPERVHVRHILLKTAGKPPSEDAAIKAKATDLLKQIKAGGNFADLAKKNSEDTGSAAKGGDLDWIARGQTVPEFEQAAFSLKPGETSDLVKTQYGYHILQVLAHDQARLKPFDEIKADLAKQWKAQRANQMMESISDKAQMALQKDPAHPEKVAADFGMEILHADGVIPGRPIPEIGTSPDFSQAIADLKKGQVSQPVALPGNKIVLAEVTDVLPPRPATFDEVKDQIRDRMVASRLNVAVQNRAKELAEKTKAMGGDLAKAAKSMGLEVKTSDDFTRAGTVPDIGSANLFSDSFSQPDGTVLAPIALSDGSVVAKIVSHTPADMSLFAAQRSTIRDQLKSQKARDRATLFDEGVKADLIKSGKVKIHEDVIKRLVSSYTAS
jgi:peptidyl-prolyl cis-trans isomerase D